jgi:excisionase family DNA binding protein
METKQAYEAPDALPVGVKPVMTVADVISYSTLSRSDVARRIKSGEIPSFLVGKRRLIRGVDVAKWIDELAKASA